MYCASIHPQVGHAHLVIKDIRQPHKIQRLPDNLLNNQIGMSSQNSIEKLIQTEIVIRDNQVRRKYGGIQEHVKSRDSTDQPSNNLAENRKYLRSKSDRQSL